MAVVASTVIATLHAAVALRIALAVAEDVTTTAIVAEPRDTLPMLVPVAAAVISTPMLAERVKVEEWSAVTPSTTLMLARGTDVVGTVWVIFDDLVNLLGSLENRLGFVPSLDGAFKPITC